MSDGENVALNRAEGYPGADRTEFRISLLVK